MIIIEDTRETTPISFRKPYIDLVARSKLEYGDYSAHINGVECPVFFERKELGDLFGTLGKDHKRFRKEINRCKADGNHLIIIIEATLTQVWKGYEYSKMKGPSIGRMLFTLMLKHHVPFVCCSSRREMSLYISEFYYSWERNMTQCITH